MCLVAPLRTDVSACCPSFSFVSTARCWAYRGVFEQRVIRCRNVWVKKLERAGRIVCDTNVCALPS